MGSLSLRHPLSLSPPGGEGAGERGRAAADSPRVSTP